MTQPISPIRGTQSIPSISNTKSKALISPTDKKIEGAKDKAIGIKSPAQVVFRKAALNTFKVIREPQVLKALKSAASSTALKTIGFICKIVSFSSKGIPKEVANDIKTGLGLIKASIALPEIVVKTGSSIYYAFKRKSYKKDLEAIQEEISQLSEKQINLLEKLDCENPSIEDKNEYLKVSNELFELNQKKTKLMKQIKKANTKIYGFFEIPKDLLEVASSSISFAIRLGSHLKTIPGAVLSGLSTAATVLGTVAGGISIALGLVDIGRSIHTTYSSYKMMRELDKKIRIVEEAFTSETHEGKKALYALELISLKKERQVHKNKVRSSAIAIGAGVLVVTGGALAIASAFTAGTTAFVLAGIGFGIGLVAVGIKIGTAIQKSQDEKKLKGYNPSESYQKIKASIDSKTLSAKEIQEAYKAIKKTVDEVAVKDSAINPDLLIQNLYPNLVEEKKKNKK